MYAAALRVELRVPHVRSLKEKRSRMKAIKTALHSRFQVSVAEVDFQDAWQRATIGVAVVAAQPFQVEKVLRSVERALRGMAEIEVLEVGTAWMDENG